MTDTRAWSSGVGAGSRSVLVLETVREARVLINCEMSIFWCNWFKFDGIKLSGFIECFTTTFLHTQHSLLTKLGRWGWLMRMWLACKKSQNTLDTSKRLDWNKTRSTRSAGKGLDSQLCYNWKCALGKVQVHHAWRHLAGRWNPSQVAATTGSLILVPPRPK